MSTKQNSVDCYLGSKIRERRKALGYSQTVLGEMLGVSYQQIQRYENGDNAIAATRLLQMADVLGVAPSFFYEGAPVEKINNTEDNDPLIGNNREGLRRILFVDDSEGDEILFRAAVSEYPKEVSIVCIQDPEKVMDFLEADGANPRVDLIVLDINMPRLNGLELLKQIRNHKDVHGIPVVMLTNSARLKEVQEAYKNEASGFIQKTTDFDTYCKDVWAMFDYWLQAVILPIRR